MMSFTYRKQRKRDHVQSSCRYDVLTTSSNCRTASSMAVEGSVTFRGCQTRVDDGNSVRRCRPDGKSSTNNETRGNATAKRRQERAVHCPYRGFRSVFPPNRRGRNHARRRRADGRSVTWTTPVVPPRPSRPRRPPAPAARPVWNERNVVCTFLSQHNVTLYTTSPPA